MIERRYSKGRTEISQPQRLYLFLLGEGKKGLFGYVYQRDKRIYPIGLRLSQEQRRHNGMGLFYRARLS